MSEIAAHASAFGGKFEMKRIKDMEYIKAIGSDSCFQNKRIFIVHLLPFEIRFDGYITFYDLLMFIPETDATKYLMTT